MRLNQTGTGRGEIIARGHVWCHARRGREIECADLGWDGEAALVPFLPGLAFDEYVPNVRAIPGEGPNPVYGPGATRYGMDAQKVVLAEFADWTREAHHRFDCEAVLRVFGQLRLTGLAPGARVLDRVDYAVRLNHKKARSQTR